MFGLRNINRPKLLVNQNQCFENLDYLIAHVPEPIRVRLSTKSIRCPDLLDKIAARLGPRCSGLMCYHPDEIPYLLKRGWKDVLLAYPNYTQNSTYQLLNDLGQIGFGAEKNHPRITFMVDSQHHIDVLEEAACKAGNIIKPHVIVDIDVATKIPFLHFGVFRSSKRDPDDIAAFVKKICDTDAIKFAGLMSYEAQVAGISDSDPREFFLKAVVQRLLKHFARSRIHSARSILAKKLEPWLNSNELILNGGGSGSVTSTPLDPLVNEVTLGSGILCPALFEHYADIPVKPAIFFALPVVRAPNERTRTVYSGGYIASGSIGLIKQPRLIHPSGWELTANEGLGEVQTPVQRVAGDSSASLEIGDCCYFVPAKSGEVMERFDELAMVIDGTVYESHKTYRGEGLNFG